MNHRDPSQLSMLELFRVEAETQIATLTDGLLALERGEATPAQLESLMRAAHSLKGAALIINFATVVRVAHQMENAFVAAQFGHVTLNRPQIDTLLRGVDLLIQISKCSEAGLAAWEQEQAGSIEKFLSDAAIILPAQATKTAAEIAAPPSEVLSLESKASPSDSHLQTPDSRLQTSDSSLPPRPTEPQDRAIRLKADNLNRLLALAGESLIVSRWLRPFSDSMQRLKRMQSELEHSLDRLRLSLDSQALTPQSAAQLTELFAKAVETRQFLADRLSELDHYDRRSAHLSSQLYFEVLRTRMQPFQDGARRFPRMVRDLSQALGKQVRLEVLGENTQVDRDILERLEAPLIHLLRNAVDHGCELPDVRAAAGKPPEAVIQLEARHSAGLLLVSVSDDGAGLDTNRLRRVVVEKQLTTLPLAERMGDAELVEFLFLPGFTMKDQVTEISGRGVGLDVVWDMVRSVRGKIRVAAQPGRGTRFQLQLPLTLSVLRSLLVEVAGEPYAIPLAQITRTLKLDPKQIETLEGRPHFAFGDQRIGLLAAQQVFGCATEVSRGGPERASAAAAGAKCPVSGPDTPDLIPRTSERGLPVVVLGGHNSQYGLVVDRFLGERELVVRPLDPRLGKVKDISAAALMEDGTPVLIVDVDELVYSLDELATPGSLTGI